MAISDRKNFGLQRIGDGGDPPYVAASEKSARALKLARSIGARSGAVLITGESGTGKTRLCREIHAHSRYSNGPFIKKGCGEFHDGTLEATLFGHTRDAYTSARTDQPGLLLEANGGTLVLDDIDCLPLPGQARLLRFLDDGGFYRLGDPGRLHVADVRIIATTNKSLESRIRANTFREDLWYRLKRWRLNMPPLRERPEDVKELACFFLRQIQEEAMEPPPHAVFSSETLELLAQLPWPGNIRGLQDTVENITLFGEPTSGVYELPAVARVLFDPEHGPGDRDLLIDADLDDEQKIHRALLLTRWNISLAARITGRSRTTIHKLIRDRGWRAP